MMRTGAFISTVAAAGVVADPSNNVVMWSFLGMPFAAPSMVAALFGCTVTRVIIGMSSDKGSRWFVRVPVDVLAIGVTFFFVVERSPELFAALGSGIFIGTLGATIIKVAERWGGKFMSVVLPDVPAAPGAPPPPPSQPPA